jgi:hypothetical protein
MQKIIQVFSEKLELYRNELQEKYKKNNFYEPILNE